MGVSVRGVGVKIAGPELIRMEMVIDFVAASNPDSMLQSGFSRPEENLTWAIGTQSCLRIPIERNTSNYLHVSFEITPHVQPGALNEQKLTVVFEHTPVKFLTVTKPMSFSVVVSTEHASENDHIVFEFLHPNGIGPGQVSGSKSKDMRPLAIALKRVVIRTANHELYFLVTSIVQNRPDKDDLVLSDDLHTEQSNGQILAQFESLGDNCEFGLVQRSAGKIEPLGLLRFSTINIKDLTRGIDAEFADIALIENMEVVKYVDVPDHDIMMRETNYGMLYHTGKPQGIMEDDKLITVERKRLKILARKLMEDIELGEKLLVVKSKHYVDDVDIAKLVLAVRRKGKATVLWVCEAEEQAIADSCYRVCDGLIRGYVDRIDVSPLRNISLLSWLRVCRAALQLHSRRMFMIPSPAEI